MKSSGLDDVALGLRHLGAVLDDHPLGEEVLERLVELEVAQVAQDLRVEAGVEEVEDGVLDAADVLVDGHPVVRRPPGRPGPRWCRGEQNRRKYQEESTKVSIVSVSRRAGPPQRGQVVFTNPGTSASGRAALPGDLDVLREHDREPLGPLGDRAAGRAVHDRDRRAPVALAADPPVAEAVVDLPDARGSRSTSQSIAFRFASATVRPSRKPELILTPSPVYASPVQPAGRWTVSMMGRS